MTPTDSHEGAMSDKEKLAGFLEAVCATHEHAKKNLLRLAEATR